MKTSNVYQKHLTLSKRILIEQYLNEGKSLTQISELISKSYKTVYNEIKKHRKLIKCNRYNTLPSYNPNCPRTTKSPFVCNSCQSRKGCRKNRFMYISENAQIDYKYLLSASRSGMNMDEEEFNNLNKIIKEYSNKGHSFYMIKRNHNIKFHISTLYNYQSKGYFDITNFDLPRKIRYKKRKKKLDVIPKNTKHRVGRTYQDFLKFRDDFFLLNSYDVEVVLMDTVEGIKGTDESVLLTLLFTSTNFLMAFIMPNKTSKSVCNVFTYLKDTLGDDMFYDLFKCILTDNGSEFSNPWFIEDNGEYLPKGNVFYCDPNRSDQKGKIEVAHEYIRRFIPKGKSFNKYNQDDITLMINHINSVCRDLYKGQSPFNLQLLFTYNEFFEYLGYHYINPTDIILKSSLFKQKDTNN